VCRKKSSSSGSVSRQGSGKTGMYQQQESILEETLSSVSEKSVEEYEERIQRHTKDRLVETRTQLGVGSWNGSPHTWHLGHASAAVVHFGLFEVVGGIHRVQPSVFYDEDDNMFCVFQGYLSNLEELIERYYEHMNKALRFDDEKKSSSPTAVIMPKKTPGEKAAELIYTMFSDKKNGEDPLIVLSELQGQYAFALYDGDKKQAFAARDSSGKEHLYFEIDDDGGLTISNSDDLVVSSADGMGSVVWEELPPGHYLCGRPIKVHQFALTPQEMKERENHAHDEDYHWDDGDSSFHNNVHFKHGSFEDHGLSGFSFDEDQDRRI